MSIASSRDARHARFCSGTLAQLGAKREGGRTNPLVVRVMKNDLVGREVIHDLR